jgi:hypothetical protein
MSRSLGAVAVLRSPSVGLSPPRTCSRSSAMQPMRATVRLCGPSRRLTMLLASGSYGTPSRTRDQGSAFRSLLALGAGRVGARHLVGRFEAVFARTPNENSVLTPVAPEKRESESSGPIVRTCGRNLEGCVRETEISFRTESASDLAVGGEQTYKILRKTG